MIQLTLFPKLIMAVIFPLVFGKKIETEYSDDNLPIVL